MLRSETTDDPQSGHPATPYPRDVPTGPDAFDEEKVDSILDDELSNWVKVASPLPEDPSKVRVELFREYRFRSFQAAINFWPKWHQAATSQIIIQGGKTSGRL